jgi:nucleoid-associated protein YgaU
MTGPIALQTSAKKASPASLGPGANGTSGNDQAKLEKASLRLYDPAPASGGSTAGAKRGAIEFQFNPKEVTIAKTAKWERKPAKGAKKAGPPEFSGAEGCKLTLEMFFDATSSQDDSVVKAVEQLFSCCVPTEESAGKKKPSPPIVVLHWGAITSFPAFVTSVSAKYTLFNGQGMPIRALVSVAMEEMPGEPFRQNPTSGSADVRRVHRTVAGDTLASVAYAEYGDPTEWRALAAYNGIDDPLRVRTGTTLLLPAPEELAAAR